MTFRIIRMWRERWGSGYLYLVTCQVCGRCIRVCASGTPSDPGWFTFWVMGSCCVRLCGLTVDLFLVLHKEAQRCSDTYRYDLSIIWFNLGSVWVLVNQNCNFGTACNHGQASLSSMTEWPGSAFQAWMSLFKLRCFLTLKTIQHNIHM